MFVKGYQAVVICESWHFTHMLKSLAWPHNFTKRWFAGADTGGAPGARPPPLKLEKIWFFGVKSWFFTRNTPKNVRASLRSAQFFLTAPPPNLKPWNRPWFVPLTLVEPPCSPYSFYWSICTEPGMICVLGVSILSFYEFFYWILELYICTDSLPLSKLYICTIKTWMTTWTVQ